MKSGDSKICAGLKINKNTQYFSWLSSLESDIKLFKEIINENRAFDIYILEYEDNGGVAIGVDRKVDDDKLTIFVGMDIPDVGFIETFLHESKENVFEFLEALNEVYKHFRFAL